MTRISFIGENKHITVDADSSAEAVDILAGVLGNSTVLDENGIRIEESG